MSFCAGLAMLGLCIPLPGMSRQALESSGWVLENDQPNSSDWYSSVWMRWNQLVLLVGVSGDGNQVTSVLVNESKNRAGFSFESTLRRNCRPSGNRWSCSASKRQFGALRCAGGWLLAREEQLGPDAGIVDLCNRVMPLFQELSSDLSKDRGFRPQTEESPSLPGLSAPSSRF